MTTATKSKFIGDKTYAMGADPTDQTTYEFKFKVVPLSSLVASHDSNMMPNTDYPQELQPRLRDRAASRTQIDNIARNLNPKVLLHDTGFIDTGPMIVGNDNVVESGNGRVLALRSAIESYPEKYRLYKVMLTNQAEKYGLLADDIESIDNPVLVRERVTKVDRAEFARQANVGAVMGMSPYEQANQDAKRLSAESVSQLYIGEDQTIDQALRLKSNDHVVNAFVKTIPANERATISDEKGSLNLQGINRLKLALFTKTYTGEAGQRLARIFGESADPYVKQIENAMFQSLPDMAKAESLIATGDRDSNMSVAPNLAEIVDTYAGLKANGLSVKDYLKQSAMFEERLDPYQKALLEHFDTIARKPKLIREFIRESAQGIIDAPPKGQISMMGSNPITKESITYGVINKQRKELREAPIVYQPSATGKRLEKPDAGRIKSTGRVGGEQKTDKGEHQMTAISTRKEFWQMTRREVGAADLPDSVVASVLKTHEQAVKQAFAEGKNIPIEVLKDYPELKKPLDKPVQSDIMTSEGRKDEPTSSTIQATHAEGTREHGTPIYEGLPAGRVPQAEERGQTRTPYPSKGDGGETVRQEPDRERELRPRSMESSGEVGDIGERERLSAEPLIPGSSATSKPIDIILDSNSDIGFNDGAVMRFDANLLAIRTLKELNEQKRQATPAEQAILAKYSGFGDSAFNEAFRGYTRDAGWERRGKELKELTTEDEYHAIETSRINAFYTTPEVINYMWDALKRMGMDKLSHPHILEPSAGSGRFLGYQPPDITARSERTAVELDEITGQMLKQMYPETDVYVMGFEKAPIPKDSIDVAISNVPFGNIPIFDPSFKKDRKAFTRSVHNYFFGKTLEVLRPGGVLAFITSHNTLDAPSSKPIRELMAEKADMVSAIRLPEGTFPDTKVTTDIIFMRKRMPDDVPGDKRWTDTNQITVKNEYGYNQDVNISQYFIDHPEMVLGKHSASSGMYRGDSYNVTPSGKHIAGVMNRIPQDILTEAPIRETKPRYAMMPSAINASQGARLIGEDGEIYVKRGETIEKVDLSFDDQNRVKSMLAIRDKARKVVAIQLQSGTDTEISAAQSDLNNVYDQYVIANGPLNSNRNKALMKDDPDGLFLLALEKDDKEYPSKELRNLATLSKEKAKNIKMPIFSQRTIRGMKTQTVNTDTDAIAVCLNEKGRLDFDRMAELLGTTPEQVKRDLASRQRIFKNPIGDWETSDKYLTGDVREKLQMAEAATSAKPEYRTNVEALKAIQPEDLPPSQITAKMGAHWIPAKYVNDFVEHLLQPYGRGGNYFVYIPATGDWVTDDRIDANSSKMYSEWGTDRMSAKELIQRILNGKPVEVTDKLDDGSTVRNPVATAAAQDKAVAINNDFKEWIWQDEERASELVKKYNTTFNGTRPRTFDGSHQVLPGVSEWWANRIHSHQKDAIWRVVQDRTALLAHEVGFGKTAVMVGSGMELRRLGLSRKNLYVVPKATHSQFKKDFIDMYPYANVLFPSEDDFTEAKRGEFVSRAVTGDWDAVILSDSQFRRLPLKPETQIRFLKEEMASIREAMEDEQAGKEEQRYGRQKESKSHKELQKALERAKVRLQTAMEKVKAVDDKTLYFEDMGVDQMFVDEADYFKNLHFTTNMGRLKGLPNTDSDRAWDMYQKVSTLQDEGNAGVVFATGTPVANTIAEMYTMMRYLQRPMLESKGLQHFDAWAKTFGETTESLEQTPTGKYRLTQRFAKFQNAPELSKLWQDVADIRVADEVPSIVKLRPRLVDESGKVKRTVIATPASDELKSYMVSLAKRADELGGKDPHEDNMLKIANDARLASLDMRMVDPRATANPDGKIAVASRKIAQVYKETNTDKGTQLVFLDLGTPKAKDKEETAPTATEEQTAEDEVTESVDELKVLRNVYGVLKDNLVASGIPEKEIAFIHDAKTNEQRVNLFRKINNGDIRVIIGSTGKLGTGVNVQERAAALHHMDAPWRPRDIEQREGRLIRQGNKVYGPKLDVKGNVLDPGKGVKVYTYVTEGSFDGYMWQAIEAKSKAIKAIMRRDNPPREIEDIDSFTMSAGEAKAIASGNPDVMKAVTLKNSLNRYQMLRASHIDSIVRANAQIHAIPKEIDAIKNKIPNMEKDAKQAQSGGDFNIIISNKSYAERPEAGEALKTAIESTPLVTDTKNAVPVGKYKGFNIKVANLGKEQGIVIVVSNPDTGNDYATTNIPTGTLTPAGVISRMDNRITSIPTMLDKNRKELEQNESNLKNYQKQATAPFEHEERLKAMSAELTRLEKKLKGEKVEDTPSDNYIPEPEEEAPGYHFAGKEPEIPAPVIETPPEVAKAEIEAVRAEVEPVEKELEVKPPDAKIEAIVEKMAEPEEIIKPTIKPEPYHGPPVATVERISFEKKQPPDTVEAVHAVNMKEQERLSRQGGTGKMKLLTKELADQFPKLYATENIPEGDKVVIAKYFHPMSHQTWYAVEYDPDKQLFFGYVDTGDQDSEWGYFSLDEMQNLKVRGLGMERDLYFKPQKIKNVSGLSDRGFESEPEETDEQLRERIKHEQFPHGIPKIEPVEPKQPPVKPIEAVKPVEPKVETPKVERETTTKQIIKSPEIDRLPYHEAQNAIMNREDLSFEEKKEALTDLIIDSQPTPELKAETKKRLRKPKLVALADTYYRGIGEAGEKRQADYYTKYPDEAKLYGKQIKQVEIHPQNPLHSETAVDAAEKLGVKKEYLELAGSNIIASDNLLAKTAKEQGYDALVRRDGDWVQVINPEIVKPKVEVGADNEQLLEMSKTDYYRTKTGKVVEAPSHPASAKTLSLDELKALPPETPITAKFYSARRGGVARHQLKVGHLVLPTKEKLQKIQDARSPRAQAIDNSRTNVKTITANNPLVESWKREFGDYDVVGIDTPRHHPKPMKFKLPKMKQPKPPKQKQGVRNRRVGVYYTAGRMVSRHPIGRKRK